MRARFSEHGRDVCIDERVEVVVEATGDAPAGIAHAIQAIEAGKHIIMVKSKPTLSRERGSPAKPEPPA